MRLGTRLGGCGMSEQDLERLKKWEAKLCEAIAEPPLYWREESEVRDRWGKTKYPLRWPSRL